MATPLSHTHIHHPQLSQSGTVQCVLVCVWPRCSFRWSNTERTGCQTGPYAEARDCWISGSAVLFSYPLLVRCKALPSISAVKPLDRKRRIQSVQQHIKGSTLVKHFTGWWTACVNCDRPEHWGYWTWRSVGDACQICSSVLSLCLWSTGRGEVLMCS